MNLESSDESVDCTPPNIVEAAQKTTYNLLPEILRNKYNLIYKRFIDWRLQNKINSFSENVLSAYFGELAKNMKSSTLWSQYSIIKTTLAVNNNVDISSYKKLQAFLKQQSSGYKPKKSKTLTSEYINKFLNEASDETYLLTKVALIIGITGACRRDELAKLKFDSMEDLGSRLLIRIADTKTKVSRAFTITGSFYYICKKYISIRPNTQERRFFFNYQKGRCTRQVVGINKFGAMPKQIAMFLQLPNSELYTGHCFRRSSATIPVDAGGDLTTLKRHGGWRSSAVAESYIDESMSSKMNIANKILNSVEMGESSSATSSTRVENNIIVDQPSATPIITDANKTLFN